MGARGPDFSDGRRGRRRCRDGRRRRLRPRGVAQPIFQKTIISSSGVQNYEEVEAEKAPQGSPF